eukprot:scaffold8452_cov185-Ochromonas_danica.AAC.11
MWSTFPWISSINNELFSREDSLRETFYTDLPMVLRLGEIRFKSVSKGYHMSPEEKKNGLVEKLI